MKKIEMIASYAQRQRLAFVLNYLKETKQIQGVPAFLAKCGLRSNYWYDLKRQKVSMDITKGVSRITYEFPWIYKAWILDGTGPMYNLNNMPIRPDNGHWLVEAEKFSAELREYENIIRPDKPLTLEDRIKILEEENQGIRTVIYDLEDRIDKLEKARNNS